MATMEREDSHSSLVTELVHQLGIIATTEGFLWLIRVAEVMYGSSGGSQDGYTVAHLFIQMPKRFLRNFDTIVRQQTFVGAYRLAVRYLSARENADKDLPFPEQVFNFITPPPLQTPIRPR